MLWLVYDVSYIPELWDDGVSTLPIKPGCNESQWSLLSPIVPLRCNMDGMGTAS